MKKLGILMLLILPIALSAQSSPDLPLFDFDPNNPAPSTLPGADLGFDEVPLLPSENFGGLDPDTGLPFGIEEQVSATVLPKVPAPRERVTILIESFSTDLNAAFITWTINGETIESGTGIINFSFLAPNSGEQSTVRAKIDKSSGGTISKEFVFAPADVDILWEAQTYTPPFYKGKSLFTRQSTLIFVAIPNFVNPDSGEKILDSELVYSWKLNGNVDQPNSGFGKSSYKVTGDLISRPLEITVTVTAIGTELIAKRSIVVSPFDPEVLLYENNPVYGIMFEKALLGDFMINRNEMEISAIPYHFSAKQRNTSNLKYKWLLNGNTVNTFDSRDSLTFRKIDDSTGRADVSIVTNHSSNILQASDTRFSIILEDILNNDSDVGNNNNPNQLEDFSF